MASNDFALIIGINDYPDFKSLKGPVEDAEALKRHFVASGIPNDNIEFVKSNLNPLTPIQKVIDDAIVRLKSKVRLATQIKARRLYVYFSGHGFAEDYDDNTLCMADWSKDEYRNSAISSRSYLKYFRDIGYFSEIFFFLDCCRNRIPAVEGKSPGIGVTKPSDQAGETNSLIIYGSQYLYSAYEAQRDIVELDFVRGYFTNALIRALEGEAADQDGKVSAQSIVDFLKTEVPLLANANNQIQDTQIDSTFKNLSSVVLAQYPPTTPLCKLDISSRAGNIDLQNGSLDIVGFKDASAGVWSINLIPGLYILVESSTGNEKSFKVLPGTKTQNFTF